MTYKEFSDKITPSVLKLQDGCANMTEAEFEDYRKVVMQEVGKIDITRDFMNSIFDMIHRNIFQTT
ncbi:MAG: hypothetical protein HFG47_00680 [Lachnospiraceae bacterium]|nr:hypothetical protein [Lachnospiraceae bacterium]